MNGITQRIPVKSVLKKLIVQGILLSAGNRQFLLGFCFCCKQAVSLRLFAPGKTDISINNDETMKFCGHEVTKKIMAKSLCF